jgi:hypothetical protein
MTELDQLIANAFKSEGKQEDVNKVYLALLRSQLFVPVKKDWVPEKDEPFRPLIAQIEGNYFLVVFDMLPRLTAWVGEEKDNVGYVELSGKDVIAGMGDKVYLCLNTGAEFYKEFSPDEVKKLKMIIARIDGL